MANEVCGGEKRSGQRRMRLGPAAKYLLSRERRDEEERPEEKISKQGPLFYETNIMMILI